MMRSFLITLFALVTLSTAFVTPVQRAQVVKAASPAFILRMAEEETPPPAASADGTFYDDELESFTVKPAISNSMRDRLIAEASSGLDSESKQSNVLLYIIGAVAILVALAGQGIFF